MKETIHVGTIKGRDIRPALGHPQHVSGSGAHRNRKHDKKIRRTEGKRACREW